jgi:hypothetical protein
VCSSLARPTKWPLRRVRDSRPNFELDNEFIPSGPPGPVSFVQNKGRPNPCLVLYFRHLHNTSGTDIMGHGTRRGQLGHTIRTFWPDDTGSEMFIDATHSTSMADLMQKIYEKWPDASLENITITSEKIHTDCLGYDLYDSGDYTDFIIITRHKGA